MAVGKEGIIPVKFAEKEEIISVLTQCLEAAKRGELDGVALVGYSEETHYKECILVPGVNVPGIIGVIDLLASEIKHGALRIEAVEALELTQKTLEADETNPQ